MLQHSKIRWKNFRRSQNFYQNAMIWKSEKFCSNWNFNWFLQRYQMMPQKFNWRSKKCSNTPKFVEKIFEVKIFIRMQWSGKAKNFVPIEILIDFYNDTKWCLFRWSLRQNNWKFRKKFVLLRCWNELLENELLKVHTTPSKIADSFDKCAPQSNCQKECWKSSK